MVADGGNNDLSRGFVMCCDTKRCGGECNRRWSVETTFVEDADHTKQ